MTIPLLRCGNSASGPWTPASASALDFWYQPSGILPQEQDALLTSWANDGGWESTATIIDEYMTGTAPQIDLGFYHSPGSIEGGLRLTTGAGGVRHDTDMFGFGYEPNTGAVGYIVSFEDIYPVGTYLNTVVSIGDERWTGWDMRFGVGKFDGVTAEPMFWSDFGSDQGYITMPATLTDRNHSPPFPTYAIVWYCDGTTWRGWVDGVEYTPVVDQVSNEFAIGDWFNQMRASTSGGNAYPRRLSLMSRVRNGAAFSMEGEIHEVVILGEGTTDSEAEALAAYMADRIA